MFTDKQVCLLLSPKAKLESLYLNLIIQVQSVTFIWQYWHYGSVRHTGKVRDIPILNKARTGPRSAAWPGGGWGTG